MGNWHTMDQETALRILRASRDSDKVKNSKEKNRSFFSAFIFGKEKKNNDIFRLPSANPRDCILSAVSDATLPVFILAVVIFAFIGDLAEALAALLAIMFIIVWASLLTYKSRARLCSMTEHLIPLSHVYEGRKIKRRRADTLSPGDIITLKTGDIVPADARLLSSENFSVFETEINKKNADKGLKKISKDAEYIYTSDEVTQSYQNMIYAGSTVASGNAMAVITEVGAQTRFYVTNSGVSLAKEVLLPTEWNKFRKFARIFSLSVLIAVIPSVFVWLIANGVNSENNVGFLTASLLFISLAATSMSELSISPSAVIISETVGKLHKNTDTKIILPDSIERIADADTVLILNKSLVCDFDKKVRYIFSAGKSCNAEKNHDNIPDWILKKIYDIGSAVDQNSYNDGSSLFEDLEIISDYSSCRISGFNNDKQSNIRYSVHSDQPFNGALTVVKKESSKDSASTELLTVGTSAEIIDLCEKYRISSDQTVPMTEEITEKIFSIIEKYKNKNLQSYIFVSAEDTSEGYVLDGIVGIGIAFPKENRENCAVLNSIGVNTVFVIPERNENAVTIAKNCGIAVTPEEVSFYDHVRRDDGTVNFYKITNSRVLVGFGKDGTAEIIKSMTEKGKRIVSVIRDASYLNLLKDNTVIASVDGSTFDSVGIHCAVKLPQARSTDEKSGLGSVRELIVSSRALVRKLRAFSDYLLFSAVMRICTVVFPLICGMKYNVPGLLTIVSTGFIGDIIALSVISKDAVRPDSTMSHTGITTDPSRWLHILGLCVSGVLSGLSIQTVPQLFINGAVLDQEALRWCIFCSVCFTEMAVLGTFILSLHRNGYFSRFNSVYFVSCCLILGVVIGGSLLSTKIDLPFEALKKSDGIEFSWLIASIPAVLSSFYVLFSEFITTKYQNK